MWRMALARTETAAAQLKPLQIEKGAVHMFFSLFPLFSSECQRIPSCCFTATSLVFSDEAPGRPPAECPYTNFFLFKQYERSEKS